MALRRGSVAVIGAGASGLVAARTLRQRQFAVQVFEAQRQVGGQWFYDEGRNTFSSMYESLFTNLPKDVMQFSDFPFPDDEPGHPHHSAVQAYLLAYADKFDLRSLVHFNTTVTRIEKKGKSWLVHTRKTDGGAEDVAAFDRVVVANGHYTKPYVPLSLLPGLHESACEWSHSHTYKTAAPFAGKRVLVVGAGFSGVDIANDLVCVGKRLWVSIKDTQTPAERLAKFAVKIESAGKPFPLPKHDCFGGFVKEIASLESGTKRVRLSDGSSLEDVDHILFCTGFYYDFPFLLKDEASESKSKTEPLVRVEGSRVVTPLYRQLWAIEDTSVCFVGIPWSIVPFPLAELQSEWVARVWAGERSLPSREDMLRDLRREEQTREREGLPHHLHRVDFCQYCNWIVDTALGESNKWRIFPNRRLRRGALRQQKN